LSCLWAGKDTRPFPAYAACTFPAHGNGLTKLPEKSGQKEKKRKNGRKNPARKKKIGKTAGKGWKKGEGEREGWGGKGKEIEGVCRDRDIGLKETGREG